VSFARASASRSPLPTGTRTRVSRSSSGRPRPLSRPSEGRLVRPGRGWCLWRRVVAGEAGVEPGVQVVPAGDGVRGLHGRSSPQPGVLAWPLTWQGFRRVIPGGASRVSGRVNLIARPGRSPRRSRVRPRCSPSTGRTRARRFRLGKSPETGGNFHRRPAPTMAALLRHENSGQVFSCAWASRASA
jgi:hypothetical protein